jgi:hypothetical protein
MLRFISLSAAVLLTSAIAACQPTSTPSATMNTEKNDVIYFDVALFSYLDRPIFDVYLNGRDIGVSGVRPVGGGGSGLMTGVAVPLGPQRLTWRLDGPEGTPGNGDTVTASNQPTLTRPDPKLRYLGVHVYPDNTVELIPEEFWPEVTERGLESIRQREKNRVQ